MPKEHACQHGCFVWHFVLYAGAKLAEFLYSKGPRGNFFFFLQGTTEVKFVQFICSCSNANK